MGCGSSVDDFDRPRLGAIFSDVDGTLVHYEAKLVSQGYEQQKSAAGDENKTNNKTTIWKHKSTGALVEAITVPSATLKGGYISAKTLELVAKLRKEYKIKFVVMTGARTSTFLSRCTSGALPEMDFGVCEGGGKIFSFSNPSASSPPVAPADDGDGDGDEKNNSTHNDSINKMRLDTEWLGRFADETMIGPWRENAKLEPIDRKGKLWDLFRLLSDPKQLAEKLPGATQIETKLDAKSFDSAFMVDAKVKETSTSDKKSSSETTTANTNQQQQQLTTTVMGSSHVGDAEIKLKSLIRSEFPSLVCLMNLSKAHISSKGCTKADVVEYLGGKIGTSTTTSASLDAFRTEYAAAKAKYFEIKAIWDARSAALSDLLVEYEEKRQRLAMLRKDVVDYGEILVEDEKILKKLRDEILDVLEGSECAPAVTEAKMEICGESCRAAFKQIEELQQQVDATAEDDDDAAAAALPVALMDILEAVFVLLKGQQQKQQQGQPADNSTGASDEDFCWQILPPSERQQQGDDDKKKANLEETPSAEWVSQHSGGGGGGLVAFISQLSSEPVARAFQKFSPYRCEDCDRIKIRRIVDGSASFILSRFTDEKERAATAKFSSALPLAKFVVAVNNFFEIDATLASKKALLNKKAGESNDRRKKRDAAREEIPVLEKRLEQLHLDHQAGIMMIPERKRLVKEYEPIFLKVQTQFLSLEETRERLERRHRLQHEWRQKEADEQNENSDASNNNNNKNKAPKVPRKFAAALFDDENDLEFVRLCDVGFAPSIAHPTVEEFLKVSRYATKCPIQGFLGTEYALEQLLAMCREND